MLTPIQIWVDGSPCASHAHQILRAGLVFRGRSVTRYEELYLEKYLGQNNVHKLFLARLKQIIPLHCEQLLMITDAGFRTDGFQQGLDRGWDFEGRIRANMKYSVDNGCFWQYCASFYETATRGAKYIGKVL